MCEIFNAVLSWVEGTGVLGIEGIGGILIAIIEAVASAINCPL